MCTCFRLIGIVCRTHCVSDVCRNGEHVDLCAGPTRNRHLDGLRRAGMPITTEVIDVVLAADRAAKEVRA
jgi:hypothetical protein